MENVINSIWTTTDDVVYVSEFRAIALQREFRRHLILSLLSRMKPIRPHDEVVLVVNRSFRIFA